MIGSKVYVAQFSSYLILLAQLICFGFCQPLFIKHSAFSINLKWDKNVFSAVDIRPLKQLQTCYCLVSMLTKMNFLSVESEGYDEWQAIFFFLNHTDLCVPLDALISSAYVCERKGNRNSFRKSDNLHKTKMSPSRCSHLKSTKNPKNLHLSQERLTFILASFLYIDLV